MVWADFWRCNSKLQRIWRNTDERRRDYDMESENRALTFRNQTLQEHLRVVQYSYHLFGLKHGATGVSSIRDFPTALDSVIRHLTDKGHNQPDSRHHPAYLEAREWQQNIREGRGGYQPPTLRRIPRRIEVDFAYERYEHCRLPVDPEAVERRIELLKEIIASTAEAEKIYSKRSRKGKSKAAPEAKPPTPEVVYVDSDLEEAIAEAQGDTLVDNVLADGFFGGDFRPDRPDGASGSGYQIGC